MPELPEVETVRRGLQPFMEGAKIERIEQNRPDLRFPFPDHFVERLSGRNIDALGRRAKYLTIHLDDGLSIISHLGMSGSFRIEADDAEGMPGGFHHERSKIAKHDHVVFHLLRGNGSTARVIYNDPRRFGFMLFAEKGTLDEHPFLKGLGVEPTGNRLSGELLGTLFEGRKTPLKSALLDQRLIAGLGNIYVCEALWRSRLSPMRAAGSIAQDAKLLDRLAEDIRTVIAEAIAAGGSSLKDYIQADGALGYFQHSFSVYGREAEPCRTPGCTGVVERAVQAGRSTFFCASCQS
ncbi:bifunctional DNA-formamidopyrimidine glycosylase/DNA-(apurinic or apyrimidinic site) lyase [Ochrobactrum sp. SD129]|jgi:formamidopyrimidine-DNA glycosylase|uniref:bifunctional DNA-formamidopyrimidine glycosylase/DNA-(apurinic or apyrimidinic site) lyase n=1 Tax=Brucella sp. TaxID=52132 RepID=UPI000DD6339E|nr:bifunctional DNA-formamidopyrimidine glycosylase/DNA-(apurinic or apyrimidinic site) lyase [Brucella sp.]MBO1024803.1 bifunctional DNA-formamidopyrimidine glycosylase/DNA-(apurinic or apyrimidinic site) lyase [Ochrobactrum sp. SD129]